MYKALVDKESSFEVNFVADVKTTGIFSRPASTARKSKQKNVDFSNLQQAEALSKPKAVRAVAYANGMNKIYIIILCHRVIGSDGNLTGYGRGLWRKKWLLDLEHKI